MSLVSHFNNQLIKKDSFDLDTIFYLYEKLINYVPAIIKEESVWVFSYPNKLSVVNKKLAKNFDIKIFNNDLFEQIKNKKRSSKFFSKSHLSIERSSFNLKIGDFVIKPIGAFKDSNTSFYTPKKLSEFLVRRTLYPLIEGKSSTDILSLKIIEPAVGIGGIIIECLNFLSLKLFDALVCEGKIKEGSYEENIKTCMQMILENCLFGVDVNPLSIEVCKLRLLLKALTKGYVSSDLSKNFKSGNSIVYADLLGKTLVSFEDNLPILYKGKGLYENFYWSIFDLPIYQIGFSNELWDLEKDNPHLKDKFLKRIKELKLERKNIGEIFWVSWAHSNERKVTNFLKHCSTNRRCFKRLKALADLHCALWFWPLNLYSQYPSHKTFKELVNWLLDERVLENERFSGPLSIEAFHLLKIALRVAKTEKFFQWHVEFAQVFARENNAGFDAVISNPPWKVVSISENEIYGQVDPSFLGLKPAQKRKRVKFLNQVIPESLKHWKEELFKAKHVSHRWRLGMQSEIPAQGGVDLCTIFVLTGERLLSSCQNKNNLSNRMGLLVSYDSIFTNKATKNLRERLFNNLNLVEVVSFNNRFKIFDIDSRVYFSCIVLEPNNSYQKTRFVHEVLDANDLPSIEKILNEKEHNKILNENRVYQPIYLSLDMVQKFFSKDTLSIPILKETKQIEMAKAIHKASGAIHYLNEINANLFIGFNQNQAIKNGFVSYVENLNPKHLPTWHQILKGETKPLISPSFLEEILMPSTR
ncbi:MAG: hypothetical protein QXP66_00775 [Candidatus Aenigmatarchaeota archaeon]